MIAMARSLPRVGVQARAWRPWDDSLADVDCLHLFGSVRQHLDLVDASPPLSVPIALSTIAWFDLPSLWREPRSLAWRTAACSKFLIRSVMPGVSSWRRRLYHAVDLLLPNSQAEACSLINYFQVPPERIHVVPNGADDRFADGNPQAFARLVGGRNFVLYAGRIEPRKNQLGFLQAMKGTDVPVVILGDVVPGHEDYLAQCRRRQRQGQVRAARAPRRSAVGQCLCRLRVPGVGQLVRNAGPGGPGGRDVGCAAGVAGARFGSRVLRGLGRICFA